MAYSIHYHDTIDRRIKRNRKHFWVVAMMISAILLRIMAGTYLETIQDILLGNEQTVAAFYEDFVKD